MEKTDITKENVEIVEETPPSLISKNFEKLPDKESITHDLVEPKNDQELKNESNCWQTRREILIKKSWNEVFWKSNDLFTAWFEKQKNNLFSYDYYTMNLPGNNYVQIKFIEKLKALNENSEHIELLKNILKDGRMLSINDIMSEFKKHNKDELDIEYVVECLVQVGILIHGNWVIRSDILYPTGSVSKVNKVPAKLMCMARDFLINKFYRLNTLYQVRIDIALKASKLPKEEINEILLSIAEVNSNLKWELLKPLDYTFELRYPVLVDYTEMMCNNSMRQAPFNIMNSLYELRYL